MTITVFTPIHRDDRATILKLYESLKAQTRLPDEWLVLLNGEALSMYRFADADWIKTAASKDAGNIGALKRQCCAGAIGDILVEVDYDDQLAPDALEKIEQAFADPSIAFAYSNCLELLPDGSSHVYDKQYGWHTRPFGEGQTQLVAFPESAQYMRRIEWAPNHVRAFRKSAYDQIGGYDKTLAVGDDHDLVCRFYMAYGERGFKHIDECLYIYNVHPGNTSNGRNRNAEIQVQVDRNYCRHAEQMYLRWAADNNLMAIDAGGRMNSPEGYLSLDLHDADIIQDLNAPRWNLEDDSVGVLRAYHVIEHLDDTVIFFNEAYRVLAPGGFLLIEVPSVNGAGAFGDPTHKKYFNLLTFEYFTNQSFARFIQPQYTGRFQKARVVEYQWESPNIPVISAQLIALKGWYDARWCGEKNI